MLNQNSNFTLCSIFLMRLKFRTQIIQCVFDEFDSLLFHFDLFIEFENRDYSKNTFYYLKNTKIKLFLVSTFRENF